MPIERSWVVKPQGDRAVVESLSAALGMPTVLTNLLVQRGIDTMEKAKEVHPDVKPNDQEAAKAFQAYQLAYEVLRQAEERREWQG